MTEIKRKTKIPKRRPLFRNRRFIKQKESRRGGVWISPTYIRGNSSTILARQTGYKPYMSTWIKRAYAYIKALEKLEDPKDEKQSFMQRVRFAHKNQTSTAQKKIMGPIIKFLLKKKYETDQEERNRRKRGTT